MEAWRKLWIEAEANEAGADQLMAAERYNLAVFHVLMAMELAAKAIRHAGLTWDDLTAGSWDDVARYTWDDLAGKPGAVTGHLSSKRKNKRNTLKLILDVPWLDNDTLVAIEGLLTELGDMLGGRDAYEACRYPDQWADTDPPPSELFTLEHASKAREALTLLMGKCHQRVKRLDPDA